MKYDIFLSDFDGTLVRADGTVSERNKAAVARYRAAGGTFVIVTGRMLLSIQDRLQELGISEGLVAAYQGATIADIKTGKLLKDGAFSREDALRAVRVLEAENVHLHAYTVDTLYANRRDYGLEIYEKKCGVHANVVEEPLSEKIEREGLRIVKVLAMVEIAEQAALQKRLEAQLGEKFYVTRSNDFLVEVMPAGQNKGSAVEFLSAHYGVPLSRIAAIGDQCNDIPMIRLAGGKFAVENAQEGLKEIAKVVPSVEQDGVAAALEYALGDKT